eukprot:scaffold10325_cov123-Isochrysis_galbana.AAC.5
MFVVTCVRTNALSGAAAAGWRPHPHAFPDLAVLMVSDFREVEERDVCCSWRAGAIYLFLPRRPAARSAAWAYVFNDPYSTINRMAAKAPQRMQHFLVAELNFIVALFTLQSLHTPETGPNWKSTIVVRPPSNKKERPAVPFRPTPSAAFASRLFALFAMARTRSYNHKERAPTSQLVRAAPGDRHQSKVVVMYGYGTPNNLGLSTKAAREVTHRQAVGRQGRIQAQAVVVCRFLLSSWLTAERRAACVRAATCHVRARGSARRVVWLLKSTVYSLRHTI